MAENIAHSTVTYSSVVAGWNTAQKDAGSNLFRFLLLFFYFKLEGYWFKSSEHSKSLNSVNTNKKILHLSSLLLYSQKINNLFSFQKFSSTEIVPPHSPSTTLHMHTFNAATLKKGLHSTY